MLKRLLLSGAAASGLLFASGAQAGYVSIDEFTDGEFQLSLSGGSGLPRFSASYNLGSNDGSIIGGYRDVISTLISNPTSVGDATEADVSLGMTNQGFFLHTQKNGVNSTTTMIWDGFNQGATDQVDESGNPGGDPSLLTDGTPAGLGASFDGLTGIEIGLNGAVAGVQWLLQLLDGDGSLFERLIVTPAVDPFTLDPVIEYASFASFTYVSGGDSNLDLGDIHSIALIANVGGTTQSFNTTVDDLRAVPEPLSVGLFGLGLLGAGALRRRTRA